MMGSCLSCCECCGDKNSSPTSSRYKNKKRKTLNDRTIQSTCFECGSLCCKCSNNSDTTTNSTDTATDTDTDIEMGGIRAQPRNRLGMTLRTLQDGNTINSTQQQLQKQSSGSKLSHYDLHTKWTLKQYPLTRAPRNRQPLFTQLDPVVVDKTVAGLLQWVKKGSWMDIITGVVDTNPPRYFYDIETLKTVPMTFELLPLPPPPNAPILQQYQNRFEDFAAVHHFSNLAPQSHLFSSSSSQQLSTQSKIWSQISPEGRFISQNALNFHTFHHQHLTSINTSSSFSSSSLSQHVSHSQHTNDHLAQIQPQSQPLPTTLQFDPIFLSKLSYKHRFYYDFGINLTFVDQPIDDMCYGTSISAITPSLFHALFYIPWLYNELSIYPRSFLDKLGLKNIILTEVLSYAKQSRKAIPIVISNTLYLDVGLEPVYYLQGVFHHELFHLFDDKLLFEMKKPIKNPLKLYNFVNNRHKSAIMIKKLLHTRPQFIKTADSLQKSKQQLQTTQPSNSSNSASIYITSPNNISTSNEHDDTIDHIAIDVENPSILTQTTQTTQATQLISGSLISPPSISPTSNRPQIQTNSNLPYRSNSIDAYTAFSHYLFAERISKQSLVFTQQVIPYIMSSFTQRGITHITPNSINQALLSMLTFLFHLEPYFFRSFPCILHLFKHPHYLKHQLHYGSITNNIILQSHQQLTFPTPPSHELHQSIPYFPSIITTSSSVRHSLLSPLSNSAITTDHTEFDIINSVNPYKLQLSSFNAPDPILLPQYLAHPPIFLLRPQKHSLLSEFYTNHPQNPQNSIYTNPTQPPLYDPKLPINDYPSYSISLPDLFHTSLPQYSRGSLYLSYLRTAAISDFIPQEYKHPSFPHEMHYYQTNQITPPSSLMPPPPTTPAESPFQHVHFPNLPSISTYQTLFWSQSTTEAFRQGINPHQCPIESTPPHWFKPHSPLRSEPVGSDPLWMLLNYKGFRYGSGGCNQRNADASVTLNKTQNHSNQISTNQNKDSNGSNSQNQQTVNQSQPQNLANLANTSVNKRGAQNEVSSNHDDVTSNHHHSTSKKAKPSHNSHNQDTNFDTYTLSQKLVQLEHNDDHIPNILSNHRISRSISQLSSHIGSNNTDSSVSDAEETDCANEDDVHSVGRHVPAILAPSSSFTLYNTSSFSSIHPNNNKNNSNSQPTLQPSQDLGFLNTYSMSAIEEDKAEVYSWLIRHPPSILNSPDPYIRAKGLELWRRLELFCDDIDANFLQKLITHKPFRIDPKHPDWQVNTDFRGYTSWSNATTGQSSWVDPALFDVLMPLFQPPNTPSNLITSLETNTQHNDPINY